jgi:hypothetical protein
VLYQDVADETGSGIADIVRTAGARARPAEDDAVVQRPAEGGAQQRDDSRARLRAYLAERIALANKNEDAREDETHSSHGQNADEPYSVWPDVTLRVSCEGASGTE